MPPIGISAPNVNKGRWLVSVCDMLQGLQCVHKMNLWIRLVLEFICSVVFMVNPTMLTFLGFFKKPF